MTRKWWFSRIAAIVAATAAVLCAAATAADLKISGPAQIKPAEYVYYTVAGLTPVDMPATRLLYFPREGVHLIPGMPWGGGDPYVLFRAEAAGRYLLHVTLDKTPDQVAEIEITVGTPAPPPPPPPKPNPYTKPPAEWLALVDPILKVKLVREDAGVLSSMYARVGAALSEAANLRPQVPASNLLLSHPWLRATLVVTRSADPRDWTTADLRAVLVEEGKPLGLQGKYTGLNEAVEAALIGGLGLTVKPALETPAVDAMAALAWAIYETGGGE